MARKLPSSTQRLYAPSALLKGTPACKEPGAWSPLRVVKPDPATKPPIALRAVGAPLLRPAPTKQDAAQEDWDFFLSHRQLDTGRAVALLEGDLRERRYRCWLDVKVRDCSFAGMMHGIACSRVFVLVVSDGYFASEFCLKELLHALELNKKVVLVHQEGLRVGDALAALKGALRGRSDAIERALDEVLNQTSIQLIVSDAEFAKTTVAKILQASSLAPRPSAHEAGIRDRVQAVVSSLQLETQGAHMAEILDKAMDTLCMRATERAAMPIVERLAAVEAHLGLAT